MGGGGRAGRAAGIRVAHIRTGIVLSGQGGALKKQLPLFKFGLGGKLGTGRQWQSWISLDDEVGAILHLLTADVRGPVNLTAPNPVTNAELTKTLGGVLTGRRAAGAVVRPEAAARRRAGRRPAVRGPAGDAEGARGQGYEFRHPTLEVALRAVLGRPAAA